MTLIPIPSPLHHPAHTHQVLQMKPYSKYHPVPAHQIHRPNIPAQMTRSQSYSPITKTPRASRPNSTVHHRPTHPSRSALPVFAILLQYAQCKTPRPHTTVSTLQLSPQRAPSSSATLAANFPQPRVTVHRARSAPLRNSHHRRKGRQQ